MTKCIPAAEQALMGSGPASVNPAHVNRPNFVRTRPRKPHRSGPVVKRKPFGRCRGMDPDGTRYT